ncbi:hypothetical protein FQR65_LT14844 [Abscondita terminalis]|nr:hypothetical protein FQR65_LT14844 [Abscondita terminalis]
MASFLEILQEYHTVSYSTFDKSPKEEIQVMDAGDRGCSPIGHLMKPLTIGDETLATTVTTLTRSNPGSRFCFNLTLIKQVTRQTLVNLKADKLDDELVKMLEYKENTEAAILKLIKRIKSAKVYNQDLDDQCKDHLCVHIDRISV